MYPDNPSWVCNYFLVSSIAQEQLIITTHYYYSQGITPSLYEQPLGLGHISGLYPNSTNHPIPLDVFTAITIPTNNNT